MTNKKNGIAAALFKPLPSFRTLRLRSDPESRGCFTSRFRVRVFNAPRNDTASSLRRELHLGSGGADVGVDLGFEFGKILLEHADQRARSLVELSLVLPGIDRIENVARHARQRGRHRKAQLLVGAEFPF